MKINNKFIMGCLILFSIIATQSCTKEDPILYSTKATNSIPQATSPIPEADGTVYVSGSTIDLTWSSSILPDHGALNKWTVYFGTTKSAPVFATNLSENKLTVPVADGNTYFWKVEAVDANGIKTTSPLFTFTAIDGSNPKMTVKLTCTTDVLSAIGVDLASDDVVDLRFLIMNKSDMSVVKEVDAGYADEVYRDFETLPDGEYVLGADLIYATNFGDLSKPITLSISLNFLQKGVVNTNFDYPNVMTNANTCSLYRSDLATVVKTGSNYTISRTLNNITPPSVTWKGKDDVYPSEVSTSETCTSTSMTGLGFGWMLDYWGEIIVSGGTLTYTITENTITIPLQKYCKTTYKGAPQPEYSIQGSGTIDNSGAYPKWTIKYDFIQSGKTILTAGNGVPDGYLEAVITTDPSASSPAPSFKSNVRRR